MKRNLLYVTYHGDDCEEGLSYAIDLAKIMRTGIIILLICKQTLIKRFEDVMASVAFAEAEEYETAKRIHSGSYTINDFSNNKMNFLIRRCRESGIDADVRTAAIDIVPAIKDFFDKGAAIDLVLLSPNVTDNGNITAKELHKLVKTSSRPIVTMARQAMLPA